MNVKRSIPSVLDFTNSSSSRLWNEAKVEPSFAHSSTAPDHDDWLSACTRVKQDPLNQLKLSGQAWRKIIKIKKNIIKFK